MGRPVRRARAKAEAARVILTETPIPGAWLIEPQPISDERGWFARTFDARHFAAHGLDPTVVQCSVSFNAKRDTLRGMHYQADPHAEPKLVRCVRGVIFDVAIDLRRDSAAYCGWHGIELTAENRLAFYLPPGVAHGFQTLADDTEVLYHIGRDYVPDAARGVRWDDPAFRVEWPRPSGPRTISERDLSFPDFEP
jgi:dTDP-4-dehydrorhamnose 3,5-epimerase